MSIRYEYDLDQSGAWHWIAIDDSGETAAISPLGYETLQDCLHAVGLMQDPGGFSVESSIPQAQDIDRPEKALSRLQPRPSAT